MCDESDGAYGSPRVFLDLREGGEICGKTLVAKLMRENGISTIPKRRRCSGSYTKPEKTESSVLDSQLNHDQLDTVWVTDITYSARGKAGSIWRRSWTLPPGGSLVGRCSERYTPISCYRRCSRQSGAGDQIMR